MNKAAPAEAEEQLVRKLSEIPLDTHLGALPVTDAEPPIDVEPTAGAKTTTDIKTSETDTDSETTEVVEDVRHLAKANLPQKQKTRHWVLIRGLSRDNRHWEAFPEQLQALFPQDRVTCMNLPGAGTHYQLSSPSTISGMVDWLRQHYANSLTQPVHLMSISMGGMLAADWMHRFPEEVAAAVMMNTSSNLNPIHERMRLSTFFSFFSTLVTSIGRRERIIVQRTSNHHNDRSDLTKRWRIYQQQQPASKGTLVKQLVAAARFSPPPLSQPLLLLASRQDRVVNPKCSESLARFWSADLRFHKSAGHDIPLDDTEWVLSQVQSWLIKSQVTADLI